MKAEPLSVWTGCSALCRVLLSGFAGALFLTAPVEAGSGMYSGVYTGPGGTGHSSVAVGQSQNVTARSGSGMPVSPAAVSAALGAAEAGAGVRYSCYPGMNPLHVPRVVWPNAEYTETHTDLRAKALGGFVDIERTWRQGRWMLNPAWAPLDFELDPLDGQVKTVGRSGTLYRRSGSDNLFIAQYRGVPPSYIKQLAGGWQWFDRLGNTIDYDNQGRVLAYSKTTGVRVQFVHDSAEQTRVLDHHGNTLMTATMADGVITRIQNRAGHSVQYQWSGAGNAKRLTQVTDSRGQHWHYQYDGNGQLLIRNQTT